MRGDKVAFIADKVRALLGKEGSGHDWEHVRRVWSIACKLGEKEGADAELVSITALLHDVDDRKVTGDIATEESLPTARRLMDEAGLSDEKASIVFGCIRSIGFSKSLAGIRPDNIVGLVVSDADLLESMGAIGVARTFVFGGSRGRAVFEPDVLPQPVIDKASYVKREEHITNHFFDKLLKLRELVVTEAGKCEAAKRHAFMVEYLRQFFEEVSAPQEWLELVDKYDGRA